MEPAAAHARLIHFSDIHVSAVPRRWRRSDWLSKRLTGWANYRWLGRAQRFRHADEILEHLAEELRRPGVDHVIFSGDATALGFEPEFARAAALLGVGSGLPGMAVPGNHDYYTRTDASSGLFERYFAAWQHGERLDGAMYPFAQKVGPVWLVGVNSARGNFWSWDATGVVDAAQLERLRRLLAMLEAGPRILVTHYPVCQAGGRPERPWRSLRNLAELVRVAADGGVSLWLHGHRHGPYTLGRPHPAPFPIVCAGSATQEGRWSYGDYRIDGRHFHGLRRLFNPRERRFVDGETFDLELAR